jgi:hypothetical protein
MIEFPLLRGGRFGVRRQSPEGMATPLSWRSPLTPNAVWRSLRSLPAALHTASRSGPFGGEAVIAAWRICNHEMEDG